MPQRGGAAPATPPATPRPASSATPCALAVLLPAHLPSRPQEYYSRDYTAAEREQGLHRAILNWVRAPLACAAVPLAMSRTATAQPSSHHAPLRPRSWQASESRSNRGFKEALEKLSADLTAARPAAAAAAV